MYSSIRPRSSRRSADRPKGSNVVPRSFANLVSPQNAAPAVRDGSGILRCSPIRLATGGCRWKVTSACAPNSSVDLVAERSLAVQAGNLVLVLVRHQVEQVACHRGRELAARAARGQLGATGPGDNVDVARRVRGVLVRDQLGHPPGEHLAQLVVGVDAVRRGRPRRPLSGGGGAARRTGGARDGSIAISRPSRKAAVFVSTATPLSSMARSMLDADWGSRPCWYATPTTTRFAAGCDPNASSATASASRYTWRTRAFLEPSTQGGDVGEVLAGDVGDHGAGRDLCRRHDRGGPVGIEAGHVGGRDAGEQVEHEEGVGPALLEPGGTLGRAGADAQVRHDRSALLGHAGLVDARHLQAVEVGSGREHLADGDDAGATDAGDEERRAVGPTGLRQRRRLGARPSRVPVVPCGVG